MLLSILRFLAGTACFATLASSPAAAAPSLVGMLKCTAEVAQGGQAARDWRIDCAFEPVKGQVQHYAGAINDPGTAPRETGKGFLVWNVLAAAPEMESGMLVGTYREGKPASNGLVGGRNDTIVLQAAVGPNQQDGINIAPRVTMIRLELPKV
jgi:hypothetical protein